MNIGGLLPSRVLHIEGKIDDIIQHSPTDTACLAHAPWSETLEPKCAHSVILYYIMVVQKIQQWLNVRFILCSTSL